MRKPLSLRPLILSALMTIFIVFGFSMPALAGGQRAEKPHAVKVLIVCAEFEDKEMDLSSSAWKRTWKELVEKLEEYWTFQSYGVISRIEAEYTERLMLPGTSADYEDVHDLNKAMRAAADDEGFRLSKFDHVILSYPSIKHSISFGGLAMPGTIWMPGTKPFDGGVIHEFGHALGVGHASSIEADGVPYPGEHREGRDGLVMMGSDGDGRIGDYSSINVPMRYKMGFIGDNHVKQAKGNGVYRIYDFECETLDKNKPIAVRVEVDDKDFWITFAPGMAKRWAKFNADGFKKGVIVQELRGSITEILDFTPGSRGEGNTADYHDIRDGALVIGETYTFPDSRMTIEPLKTGSTGKWKWIEIRVGDDQKISRR